MADNDGMERRKFISILGKLLLIVGGLTSEGCAKLLQWSAKQEHATTKEIKGTAKTEEREVDAKESNKQAFLIWR